METIPFPLRPTRGHPALDPLALESDLRAAVEGEVRFDDTSRALYATDSSNYRHTPIGVVVPRTLDDVVATVALCRAHGAPLLSRGGGTSLAGQCCNVAVVIDWTKHLGRIEAIDPVGRTATVLPGTILDHLRKEATQAYQLTLGPDPSTHDRCSIGGMIGNDSCGMHAQMAGRMAENVESMEILTYDGLRMWVGKTNDEELNAIIEAGGRRGEIYAALRDLRDKYADDIRGRYPHIPRRVSGYNLDSLLAEHGFDVARALVGSEGTCATILRAKVRLVYSPPHRALLVVGYPDIFEAADRVAEIDKFKPLALEGMDDGLLERARRKKLHVDFLEELPEGGGLLVAEFGGETAEEAADRAREVREILKREKGLVSSKVFDDPVHQAHIWAVRESGLGATARVPGMPDTWEGWEDSAVPPERLGDYLRDFRRLLDRHGYDAALYGHFGQGCLHCRIDFDFQTEEGRARYRVFMEDATDLVVSYGGSLSGEHGDGQSRAEFLPKMFGKELVEAFREFKGIWDPEGKMNPGKIVDPRRVDQDLRIVTPRWLPTTHFQFPEDEGKLERAALRCVGVGLCRRHEGGVMCPSYMATREEMHSTRGRAHLLFEMLQGQTLQRSWRDEGVKESLDLCLACKGCKGECPVHVDVATFKAEFLSHYYEGRPKPRLAYAMGLSMYWMRLARLAPWLVNALTQQRALRAVFGGIAGVDPRRKIPTLAPRSFTSWVRSRPRRRKAAVPSPKQVVLFPDTWNNTFHPESQVAATEFLEEAGYDVIVPRGFVCCGRPLYDFGMLDTAKRMLRRTIDRLRPYVEEGIPIVALEPSCASVFRDELRNLFPKDDEAMRLSEQFSTFSQFVAREKLEVPELKMEAIVQPHCHEQALEKLEGERAVLERMGMSYRVPDSGCCGMAGAFGYEAGRKFDVSMACGERVILPDIRQLDRRAFVVADGFSCRTQIEDATDRRSLHLAEVLRFAQRHGPSGTAAAYPERIAENERTSLGAPLGRRLAIAGAVGGIALLALRGAWRGAARA
ncbi:FAD-binding and (Fe-S)-binding domain-containing protein [Vulgatibacter incomptus]|uniref:Glycolate dehydrogenase n=1 Tax=Vulgatibacter incomptus TaxID=1391653 RepID=A0A0K1P9R3_9BACT|nr:FAD-binding and (Fe-S)-binding domain-containing protein [Vulgatibacter incomptus]AKU90237.1 Glycolate dehydrogenase [Vulgatibacter incomptus]